MPELAAPTAARLRRPSWRDTRLVVGVVLVLVSVVLGAGVVAAADDSEPVYAARDVLTSGDPVQEAAVTVVQVRVDAGLERYFSAREDLPADLMALRTVGAGELLPRSAVGRADELRRKPVAVPYPEAVPSGLAKGALVDIWVSPRDRDVPGAYEEPRQVVAAAEVAEVVSVSAALGVGRASSVQVLLVEEQMARVLDALANEARVAVVVVPGSAPPRSGG